MVREKIRATLLVKKLEDHVLGSQELAATQVTAALGLLKKCVPDLARSEVTGEGGGPVKHAVSVSFVGSDTRSV